MAFAVWVRGLAASLVVALVTGSTSASLAAPLERYGALPSLEDISLSPDGKAVAMIRRVGEDQFIIVRSLVKSEVLWATKIGPVKHVGAITIPVMLIHGKDDTVVDFSQSKEMYDAMKRAGKSVELVTLVAEDHWLSRAATRMQMLQETARFLKANNPAD